VRKHGLGHSVSFDRQIYGWRYACLLGYTFHTCYLVRCHLIKHEAGSIHEQKRLHYVQRSGLGDFQSGVELRQITADSDQHIHQENQIV
jgi:hypothetical protein